MSDDAEAPHDAIAGLTTAKAEAVDFATEQDPYLLFQAWYQDAASAESADPNAMALATVDGDGLPNVRIVLLKGLDSEDRAERGFVFYTNVQSAKGRELLSHQKAALSFHWKSLQRQVRLRGRIVPVSPQEADAYFATRPRGSQLSAAASDQSRPLDTPETLAQRVDELTSRYEGKPVPRPEHWSGFRLFPVEFEFWQAGEFRMHDRRQFRQTTAAGGWHRTRLYP